MHPLTVFELRNYITKPGGRDVLIDMFEEHFIESQEALGSRVAGTFRNLDDSNRFVWIRGFETMQTRHHALSTFYSDPLWASLRDAANATMIDSDDVLLLRPLGGIAWAQTDRAPMGAKALPDSTIVCLTYFLTPESAATFPALFADEVAPALRDAGGQLIATLVTEHSRNSYPRLPVRENETVFVALLRFLEDVPLVDVSRLAAAADVAPPQVFRLQPTARSALT